MSYAFTPIATAEENILVSLFQASQAVVSVHAQIGAIVNDETQSVLIKETGQILTRRHITPVIHDRFGTGVLIHPSGLLVTNAHNVYKATRIVVTTSDQAQFAAEVLFVSPAEDLAILKIHSAGEHPYIPVGNSETIKLRDPVYSIGGSALIKNTFSEGRVKGIAKRKRASDKIGMIQVNFNIYGGDSGSPLLNRQGELIGLMTAADSKKSKVAFAIPSERIAAALREIERKKTSLS